MPFDVNRRTFIKKISSFALTAPLLALLPFRKSKIKALDAEYNWNTSHIETLSLDDAIQKYGWKTHSTSVKVLVDENTPLEKTMKRELMRSLYGS